MSAPPFCTLLPVQTHKGFPKRKALYFITLAFSDCLTFSALALCPQFTDAAFHRMVCDGCYHARTIPDGEQLPSAVIAHRERPGFPEAGVARSHTGGLGASFGSAITESLLPEKAIHLSRNTVPPGSNCYRLRHGKDFPAWKPLNLQRTFFLENLVLPEKKFLKTSPPY